MVWPGSIKLPHQDWGRFLRLVPMDPEGWATVVPVKTYACGQWAEV